MVEWSRYMCDVFRDVHVQNTYLWEREHVVSQVIFSWITLQRRVDQLVKTTVAPANTTMMMQLSSHYWEVKNLQRCTEWLPTPIEPCLVGQCIVELRWRGITCTADVIAICEYERSASPRAKLWENLRHSAVYGRSRAKHAVSEGVMTSAEDMRPEANRLVEWRPHALQCHRRVIVYTSGVLVGRRLNLWRNAE